MADFTFLPARFHVRLPDGIDGFFRPNLEELNGIGAEVIGISTDSVHSHRAWIKTPREQNGVADLQYPLASDVGGKLARNTTFWLKKKASRCAVLYIINPEGVLQYAVVHDLNIGRSVDETLRVLQGLQTGGCARLTGRRDRKT
jgi:peroxiredoxin (alkyl hydroperoxide reductase subunit C)